MSLCKAGEAISALGESAVSPGNRAESTEGVCVGSGRGREGGACSCREQLELLCSQQGEVVEGEERCCFTVAPHGLGTRRTHTSTSKPCHRKGVEAEAELMGLVAAHPGSRR